MKSPSLGYILLRTLLGLNFFLHGAVRVLWNYSGFIAYVQKGFESTPLPMSLVTPIAYAIPPIEIVVGLALLIGAKPRYTLIATAGLLGLLISGMSLQQKWDVVGTQMIYVICVYLLGSEMTGKAKAE